MLLLLRLALEVLMIQPIYSGELILRNTFMYNMSGGVVSDIQARAEGEWIYVQYNIDAIIVKFL